MGDLEKFLNVFSVLSLTPVT